MLSLQEALLFQAAKDEQDRIDAQGTAGVIGGMTGVVLGTTGGMIPHSIGKQINKDSIKSIIHFIYKYLSHVSRKKHFR